MQLHSHQPKGTCRKSADLYASLPDPTLLCVRGCGFETNKKVVLPHPDGLVEMFDAGVQSMHPTFTVLKVLSCK